MKKPKRKSYTSDAEIKRMIWDMCGSVMPVTEKQFMSTPVNDAMRLTYYENKSKYLNHKTV